MRFLRKIEGKTRRDRIRNKIIRETVGVQPIQEYVERVYEAREIGKKPRG